ncbi:MAG: conserved rane protein of unknown function [Frankiales bacterium]|nr:conserved rane protein of unknown function [Frankiales bacterium]
MIQTTLLLAAEPKPAGGAALGEVFAATAGVGFVTLLLLGLAVAHRTRRTTVLARFADAVGRRTGRPGWVALPAVMVALSLITALFGMLWDISLHIGRGRDEGPLANPAHYFILVGLFLVFAAGMLAVVLPLDEKPGPASVKITKHWHAPVGGILIAASGFYALIGFPLDDVWHRLFGQDVTLWGPTHLMLITGAGLSLIGQLVLEQEGHAATAGTGVKEAAKPIVLWGLRVAALGGMLIGLSVFQAEYDFGVPQFRLVLQPMMIAGAAGLALVAARLVGGRGAALGAAIFFLTLRGVISLIVGPALGEPTPSLPLYLGSAILIELLALTPLLRSPMAFGAVGGLLIGTLGSVTEAIWSYVAMPLPWTSDMRVEGLLMTVPVAVAAGLCGALLSMGVQGRLPRPALSRTVLVASLLVLTASVGNGLYATVPEGAEATVALTPAGEGMANAEVTLDPASVADDPSWVQLTAWQGGGLVVDRLERTGPGTYRSTEPVPVDGDWKTLLRVHDGRTLAATPVFLPEDVAIDAEEVPAEATSTRGFVPEITLLQRERDLDAPGWLWAASNAVVLVLSLALILALAWGVGRLSRRITPGTFDDESPIAAQEQGLPHRGGALRPGVA